MSRPHHAPTALSPNASKLESHGSLIERLDTLSQAIQHRLERPYDNIRREIEVLHSILRNYNLILGVGAFIAGVQTSILAVARTLFPSTVQRATIWFAYVGLTLDVLGTSTGVLRSLILQHTIANADRTRTQLAGDASRIQHYVSILKEKCQRPNQPLPATEVQGTVDDFHQQARLCEKFEDLYSHTLPASPLLGRTFLHVRGLLRGLADILPIASLGLGLALLLVSTILSAVASQPMYVWLTCTIVAGVVILGVLSPYPFDTFDRIRRDLNRDLADYRLHNDVSVPSMGPNLF